MTSYTLVKILHTLFAALSIGGFVLRGALMLRGSALLRHRVARVAPHAIDSLFLVSGIGLVAMLDLPVVKSPWLLAKLSGLVVYVALGLVALRLGRTPQVRLLAFAGAVAVFAYIVGAAVTKSPLSWIAALAA